MSQIIFSIRLDQLMTESGLTNSQLTRVLGCSNSLVSKWRKNDVYPSIKYLIKLSKYFGVSIDYIVGRADTNIYLVTASQTFFHQRLKNLRTKSDVSKNKVSVSINVEKKLLNNWESGKSEPNLLNLVKLCDYFNCSLDYLIGIED